MATVRIQQTREHGAWLDLCQELAHRGININDKRNEPLACAIRKWGEELHHLRLADPRYDQSALEEKRIAYVGRYEQGTYPDPGRIAPETREREATL